MEESFTSATRHLHASITLRYQIGVIDDSKSANVMDSPQIRRWREDSGAVREEIGKERIRVHVLELMLSVKLLI